jgi:hypothetical protein
MTSRLRLLPSTALALACALVSANTFAQAAKDKDPCGGKDRIALKMGNSKYRGDGAPYSSERGPTTRNVFGASEGFKLAEIAKLDLQKDET